MRSKHMWRNWLLGISCLVSLGVTRVAAAQTNPPENPVPRDGAPPLVVSSAEPAMVLPPPPVVHEPGYVQKIVVTPVPAPRWVEMRGPSFRPQFGLGGALFTQGQMTWSGASFTAQSGHMLQFLLRTTRFLTLEGSVSWLTTFYDEQSVAQSVVPQREVPIRVGARFLPCALACGPVQPYLVAALGVNYVSVDGSQVKPIWPYGAKVSDNIRWDRLYFHAEGGVGLEFRIGKHFAFMADARAVGEYSISSPENVWMPVSISKKSRFALQGTASVAVYF